MSDHIVFPCGPHPTSKEVRAKMIESARIHRNAARAWRALGFRMFAEDHYARARDWLKLARNYNPR